MGIEIESLKQKIQELESANAALAEESTRFFFGLIDVMKQIAEKNDLTSEVRIYFDAAIVKMRTTKELIELSDKLKAENKQAWECFDSAQQTCQALLKRVLWQPIEDISEEFKDGRPVFGYNDIHKNFYIMGYNEEDRLWWHGVMWAGGFSMTEPIMSPFKDEHPTHYLNIKGLML